MNTEKSYNEILNLLFMAYGQEQNRTRIAVYVKLLSIFPAELLRKACGKLMYESKYLPSVAEIVAACEALAAAKGAIKAKRGYEEVWLEVERALQKYGLYQKPEWSDDIVATAVQAIGWNTLCMATTKEMAIIRAQFRDIYNNMLQRDKDRRLNAYILGGKNETQALMSGMASVSSIIGGPKKCQSKI